MSERVGEVAAGYQLIAARYRPIAEIVADLRALGIPDEDLAPIVKIACSTCGYGPKPCQESGCPGSTPSSDANCPRCGKFVCDDRAVCDGLTAPATSPEEATDGS